MGKTQGFARKSISTALAFVLALSLGFGCTMGLAPAQAYADANAEALATDLSLLEIDNCGPQEFTGQEIRPYDSSANTDLGKIRNGEDYTVTYANNIEKGTATATLTGIGDYSGSVTVEFEITEWTLTVTAGDATLGTFTRSQIEELAEACEDNAEPQRYQYGRDGSWTAIYVPAKSYVTYDALLAYFGVEDASSISPMGADLFGTTISSAVAENGKFYPAAGAESYSTDGATDVPAVLALEWMSAPITSTAAVAAQEAADSEASTETRTFSGILESDFNAESSACGGNRFVTNVWYLDFDATLPANHLAMLEVEPCGMQEYTGKALEPYADSANVGVSDLVGEDKIRIGEDFTVTYENNVEPGTGVAVLTGMGDFTGTIRIEFPIMAYELTVRGVDGSVLGTLDRAELEELAASSSDNAEAVRYQYGRDAQWTAIYVPAKSYVTYDALFAYFGLDEWGGATPKGADEFGNFTWTPEYDENGMFYPAAGNGNYNADGAVSVPAILALEWANQSVTSTCAAAAEAASEKEMDTEVRAFVGIPADEFNADGSCAGNRFVSNVWYVNYTPASLPHEAITDNDDPSAWYYDAVNTAIDKGWMQGYSGTTLFGPSDSITRGQVATILYRMTVEDASATTDPAKFATENTTGLSDLAVGQYYTAAVNWAVENGVITGYTNDSTFKADNNVTRQELGTMIGRYAEKFLGADIEGADATAAESTVDWATVEAWAKPYLAWTADNDIMSGVGGIEMQPGATAERSMMAKMIVQMMA